MNKKDTCLIRIPITIKKHLKILSAQRGEYIYETLAKLLLKEFTGTDIKSVRMD